MWEQWPCCSIYPGTKWDPSNCGGKRFVVLLSPPGRGTLSPVGTGLTPRKRILGRNEVRSSRIGPCISSIAPWLGTFIPTGSCLGIWRILRRWGKEGIEFHLLFFYHGNNAWWGKKKKIKKKEEKKKKL